MSDEWHYTKDGQKYGPLSAADLKALARSGQLAPTDMVWKAGMAEWKVASGVKGLFQTVTPVSSPPLPAPAAISPKLEGAPEPPSIAEAASPEAGEAPDSLSFTDKVKGRLGKAIGPKGADKLAVAKSFFKKNRLWFGVGTGVAACIIVILFLLPAGTLPGGKKGYTQRILDLDANQQKEYGIRPPKGAKALFAPGSVEDFVQSLTMFKSEDKYEGGWAFTTYDTQSTINGTKNPHAEMTELRGVSQKYQMILPPGLVIKQKCWDMIYGPQTSLKEVNESTGSDRRFGGGSTVLMHHWTVSCTDETVLVRGISPKSPLLQSATKDGIHIYCVNFSKTFESICPTKTQFNRLSSFKY